MEYTDALRRMTIVDSGYVETLLRGADAGLAPCVAPGTLALARIAALAGAGASKHSYAVQVDAALGSGLSPEEIVGVLAGIAPVIGSAATATAAPALALALGYDTEAGLERLDRSDAR